MDGRLLLLLLVTSCATLNDDQHIEIRGKDCVELEIILDKDHTTSEPVPIL